MLSHLDIGSRNDIVLGFMDAAVIEGEHGKSVLGKNRPSRKLIYHGTLRAEAMTIASEM